MKQKIKKILRPILYSALILGAIFFSACFITYNYFPGAVEEVRTRVAFYKADLEVKTIEAEGYSFEYIEGGSGETILFVHGFGGQKRSWLRYCKLLSSKYRVIAVDLPGHGGTPHVEGQNYDLESLTKTLHVFTKAANLEKFHLVGLSMGGGVSTVYAAHYPQDVKSLILLNPFGVITPKRSDLELHIQKGKNLFFPRSLNELDELITYTTGKPLSIAKHFKEYLLYKMNEKKEFYAKAFDQLTQSTPVEKLLPKIQTRTLVLIGGKDQIIHPSSFQIYKKLLPNARTFLIQDGTHVFVGSYFDEALEQIEAFLQAD